MNTSKMQRARAIGEVERAEQLLSLAATYLGQAYPHMKKSDRAELRKIMINCSGHSGALARISILTYPAKRKAQQ